MERKKVRNTARQMRRKGNLSLYEKEGRGGRESEIEERQTTKGRKRKECDT